MTSELKKGDVVVATDDISRMHNCFQTYYPVPSTIGTVLDAQDKDSIYVQWSKGSTSGDDKWYVMYKHVRKITKREELLFVKYYERYKKSNTTSVKQYYKCPSKSKQAIEEQLLSQMNYLQGCGYKILGGNSQYFIAAFLVGKILHVHTVYSVILVDTVYTHPLYEKRQEHKEELERLVNDAMQSIVYGDD